MPATSGTKSLYQQQLAQKDVYGSKRTDQGYISALTSDETNISTYILDVLSCSFNLPHANCMSDSLIDYINSYAIDTNNDKWWQQINSKEVLSKDEKHGGYFPLYLHHNKSLIHAYEIYWRLA